MYVFRELKGVCGKVHSDHDASKQFSASILPGFTQAVPCAVLFTSSFSCFNVRSACLLLMHVMISSLFHHRRQRGNLI